MSTPHTHGPWEAVSDNIGNVTVYGLTSGANIDVCAMGGNTNDGANARLIAAAPDLLAALQTMCNEFADLPGMVHDERAAVETARRAIAKATGGQL